MKKRSKFFDRSRGLSLIEVLAALSILGTVLVSLILAASRLRGQLERAESKLEAVEAAEALLESWWRDPRGVPRDAEGEIEGRPGLRWRTRIVPTNASASALGAQVLRLEIVGVEPPEEVLAVELLFQGPMDDAR